jgi:hypothetical protein
MDTATPTPDSIMQLGFAFAGSKVLLSAIELGVFTRLAPRPATCDELTAALGLHPRSALDFFDALVALRMLDRDDAGVYRNTPSADAFLDKSKPAYVGGILEMANARLYKFWDTLTDGLRTGDPQNEVKDGEDLFGALYKDPERLRIFLRSMTGLSIGAARAIAQKFAWHAYTSFADMGCAQGCLPVQIAQAHSHLTGIGFDLDVVRPVFNEYVAEQELAKRLTFQAGDLFGDDSYPRADVLVFGHILHDWGLARKRQILAKAYDALPSGGAVIVYDCMIDDARRDNVGGLLMSLNMLIETREGFDYTPSDCIGWMREAGFKQTRVEHLVGAETMVVGIK